MVEMKGWRIFTPRYRPASSLEGHLTFALKYEGIDLGVLHRLFERIDQKEIVSIVRNSPTGAYARRLWFLYEWLTGKKIPLEDVKQGSYVKVLDPSLQLAIDGDRVRRQRVINNLPGTPQFCPLVFRTQKLEDFFSKGLKQRANEVIGRVPRDVVSRTAAFLLLKDSRSSYAIEGEEPPRNRIERWGRAIGEAGANPIDRDELVRLQEIVIGDTRFVHPGLREYGGFVGEHDRDSGMPIPEHISARAEDLNSLLTGLSGFNDRAMDKLDPVVAAACIAFGFVYIHPFEDGNGRIHRYLIHHVLAQSGFNPPEVVFPVSAVILKRINEYRDVLQQYSHRMLPFIEWQVSEDRNVRVTNETDFLYRFFDATPHTEFLFSCVEQTVEKDLPEETRFLQQYDEFRRGVESVVDMPDKTVNLLFRLIRQNKGRLSKRAREKEFAALDDAEAEQIEQLYSKWFSSNSN
ncbi:MAG: Fic family protein, partial [Spirochaetales bacterium]|nr:Fic family protein [Spirochaetales bacterium]MCF7939602.1 Fic family protein [Spirochaetales bacterium]